MRKLAISLVISAVAGLVTLQEAGIAIGKSDASKRASLVTFSKDVAPIFIKRCAECHSPGQSAPMSLLSYKDARAWARSIKEKVITREMPPWHADPGYGEFKNDRRLTAQEINTIVAWVDGGAKEGNTNESPRAPELTEGWRIGKPDLVLEMPEEVTLNAQSNDEYHYIGLQTNFTEDKYIQMAQLRPGNPRVVHHITAFIIAPPPGASSLPNLSKEAMEKLRAEMESGSIFYYDGELSRVKPDVPVYDDGCVLASGGSATSRDGSGQNWSSLATPLTVFSPGADPVKFDTGMARIIPAGSKIILQAHYWKQDGKVEKDRSMLGLKFAPRRPERAVLTELIINNYFKIPAGAANHRVSACWTAPEDINILSLMPHMHWRGLSMTVEALYGDGRSEVLLKVPKYNFLWQTVYYLKQHKFIPKGTKLRVVAYFDNSTKNKLNPDPSRDVRAGEPTYDEMMACFVDYTIARQGSTPAPDPSRQRSR